MIRRALPGLAVAALVALGGCVTLFPKETPVPLYRFGDTVQAPAASGPSFTVRNSGLGFDQADLQLAHEPGRGHPEIVPDHHDRLKVFTVTLPQGGDQLGVFLAPAGEEPLLELVQHQ